MKLFFFPDRRKKIQRTPPRFVENSFNQSKSFRLPHRNISEKTGKVFVLFSPRNIRKKKVDKEAYEAVSHKFQMCSTF